MIVLVLAVHRSDSRPRIARPSDPAQCQLTNSASDERKHKGTISGDLRWDLEFWARAVSIVCRLLGALSRADRIVPRAAVAAKREQCQHSISSKSRLSCGSSYLTQSKYPAVYSDNNSLPTPSHKFPYSIIKIECAKSSYTVIEGQNCPTPPRMIKTPTAKFTIRLYHPQSAEFFFQAAGFRASGSSGLTRYLRSPSLRGRRWGRH